MSTARTDFQVETLRTQAFIFGPSNPFTQQLKQAFITNHCQVEISSQPPSTKEDLDYLLIFPPLKTDLNLTHLSRQLPQTKIFLLLSPLDYQFTVPKINNLTTIYLGEIYDCRFLDPRLAPHLYAFLSSAQHQHQLIVPGDGLFSIFPLSQTDFVRALVNLVFNPYIQNSQLILQSLHDISLLSLAHQIRTVFPNKLDLKFDPNQKPLYSPPPTEAVIFQNTTPFMEEVVFFDQLNCLLKLDLSVPFPHPPISAQAHPTRSTSRPSKRRPRLKPLFSHQFQSASLESVRQQVKFVKLPQSTSRSKFKKFNLRRFYRPAFIFLFSFMAYLLSLVFAASASYITARRSWQSLRHYQSPSQPIVFILKTNLTYLDFNFKLLAKFPLINHSGVFTQAHQFTSLALYPGIPLLQQIAPLSHHFLLLSQHLFGKSAIDNPNQFLNQLALELDDLYNNLSFLSLKCPDKLSLPYFDHYQPTYLKFKTELNQIRHQTFLLKTIFPQMPDLLGVGGDKKYLLLLQNNMELRPTGGFIGSVAILELSDAQLFNFQVLDVYQVDGQLKGHVRPPQPIKEYLGEASWYLRDSNWDPNYPVTAERVEWFARKSLKQNFDGVFALNLNFIQQLLYRLGPVQVPDYKETITADNLFERAEYHSEIDHFSGSTQKQDFLAALANQLILRFKESHSSHDFQALLTTSLHSLTSHDLLLFVNNPQLNSIFDLFNWDGRLQSPQCPHNFNSQNCFQDYLYLVDANLGVNKVNYFIRRTLNLNLKLSKDLVLSHHLVINYTNTAISNEWLAGLYKNYQRVYLPYDTTAISVKIGDQPLSQDKISLKRAGGKTIIGYLVQIPLNQSLTISIDYQTSKPLPQTSPLTYSLYWQRQPGTSSDPLVINLDYPLFLHPQVISPRAEINSQRLNFQLINSRDRRITVQFQK